MKHSAKSWLTLLLVVLLCTLAFPLYAQAAAKNPGQVKKLKASAAEASVTLRWNKVSNATGYNVYQLNTTNNTYVKIGRTKGTQVKVTKLKSGTACTFAVSAYRTVASITYEGKKSTAVKVTPVIKKPAVPSVQIDSCSNGKVGLKWNKTSYASYYEVFQRNAAGKYVSIGTTTKTAVTIQKLTNGTTYCFKVRAVRKVSGSTRAGSFSAVITAKPVKISTEISSIRSMYYSAKVVGNIKVKTTDGKKTVSIKSGTRVTVTKRASTCTAKLKNGTMVYIPRTSLQWVDCVYDNKTDYSRDAKEGYVNAKGYSSNTKYLIWVSLNKQRFYIFKGSQCNWKLFKTYLCSSGKATTCTPRGTHRLWKKSRIMRFDAYSYADYASYFSGNAIHSWVYTNDGNRYNDGVLGRPASHGCIRLGNKEVKYVYDRIPLGTTVIIY